MSFKFLRANRGLIITTGLLGVPSAFFAWDRFETDKLLKNYKALAKAYGDSPMPHDQLPTKITFLVESADREGLSQQLELFEEFVEPILTSAGLEFEWVEASEKKHFQQLDDNLQKSNSSRFSNINSWRVSQWLNKEISILETMRFQHDFYENLSFLHKVAIYLGLKAQPSAEPFIQKEEITKATESFHENEGTGPVNMDTSEQQIVTAKNAVLQSLLPASPGYQAFQQGLVVLGEMDEFRAVFRTVHGLYTDRPEGWMLAFGQYPFRLGFLYSPHRRSIIQRIFFKRKLARSLLSGAFDIASDNFLLLDPIVEENIMLVKADNPQERDTRSSLNTKLLSPTGTVLLLKTSMVMEPNQTC